MSKESLRSQIDKYTPFDQQEMRDKQTMLSFIDSFEDIVTRDNVFGHFTASAFVVNESKTHVVILRHNIFGDCVYPGGHADGEYDLLSVALREVEEETGLIANPSSEGQIFCIQCVPVKGHVKNGQYVSSHTHHDVAFIAEVRDDDMDKIRVLESENSEVMWIPIDNTLLDGMADWFKRIYIKFQNKFGGFNYEGN
jgi:8-oxo-dGTP pyrophosphatase MutT (NUDIX family)